MLTSVSFTDNRTLLPIVIILSVFLGVVVIVALIGVYKMIKNKQGKLTSLNCQLFCNIPSIL